MQNMLILQVELLEIFGKINFKLVQHLESCCIEAQRGEHHFLGVWLHFSSFEIF